MSIARAWITFIAAVVIAAIVLLHRFLFPPPPNYAIVALAGLAVIMTLLLRKEPTRGEKAAWMAAAMTLMGFEMWAVTHDRTEQEDRHIAELAQQQIQFNNTLAALGLIQVGVSGIPTRIEGDISHLKPNVTVLQPPRDYGNLKERCVQLVTDINALVRHRQDQLQNAAAYSPPLTPEKMNEWNRSNDAEFRNFPPYGSVFQRTKDLRIELAQRNLRDAQLDDILNRYDENAEIARNNAQFQWLNLISISDMEAISARLQVLANLIPSK